MLFAAVHESARGTQRHSLSPTGASPLPGVERSHLLWAWPGRISTARDPHQKWVVRCTPKAIMVKRHRAGSCALPARFRLRIRLSARISRLTVSCSLQKYSA